MLLSFTAAVTFLIALSLLSGAVTRSLARTFMFFTRSPRVSVTLLSILFFPGTVIHELSHVFAAEIMGVPTGKLSLTPEGLGGRDGVDGQEQEIQAGSVAIAKTDPFRRTIIGVAPVIVGMGTIAGLSTLFLQKINNINMITIITFYIIFTISNSMFSSREDLKGVFPVVGTLGILLAGAFIAGFRFTLTGQAEIVAIRVLESLTGSLGLVLALNGVILLLMRILLAVTKR